MDTTQHPIAFDAMPTLANIPSYFAGRSPDRAAIRFGGGALSWDELDRRSSQVAYALRSAGVEKNDHIAFLGKGSADFFALMFGAAKAGAILTPIQWRLAVPEVAAILNDAAPRLLFVDTAHMDALSSLGEAMRDRGVIIIGNAPDNFESFDEWLQPHAAEWADRPSEKDVALQLYTSGTTGVAKGVMLTHANLLSGRREGSAAQMDWNTWLPEDVNLVALPVGHIGGIGWAIVGFVNGVTTVVHSEFDPGAVLEAIHSEGVSKLFVVPTALQFMLMHPRAREIDTSGLRYILYGAAPIALDLLREATRVFGCGFCQQYGATETTGTIVYLPPEDHDPEGSTRMRSAGKPMPGVELRIVSPDGSVLDAGETGEVETRSVANMKGYWKRDEDTRATVDEDGWLRTGDAGYLDLDGYLFIQDRIKDMICSGAENVYPAEVESALFGHPAVQEVAVFGVPDEKWGEAVKAAVVLVPGSEPDEAAIMAHARARIASFKVTKSIDFISEMPKGPSGKILRRSLREPYWSGRDRKVN